MTDPEGRDDEAVDRLVRAHLDRVTERTDATKLHSRIRAGLQPAARLDGASTAVGQPRGGRPGAGRARWAGRRSPPRSSSVRSSAAAISTPPRRTRPPSCVRCGSRTRGASIVAIGCTMPPIPATGTGRRCSKGPRRASCGRGATGSGRTARSATSAWPSVARRTARSGSARRGRRGSDSRAEIRNCRKRSRCSATSIP